MSWVGESGLQLANRPILKGRALEDVDADDWTG
jgi:hypothetical protein